MDWSAPDLYPPLQDPALQWCVMIFYAAESLEDQAMRMVGPFESRKSAEDWAKINKSNLWYGYELFALERP